MPFFTVKYCFSRIIESENEVTKCSEGIQDVIADKLSGLIVEPGYMSVLNSIFDTNFPSSDFLNSENLPTIREIVFRILCSNLTRNFWIIFIDDADYIDPDSFDLLPSIFETASILLVFTIGKHFRKWTLRQKEIYLNNAVAQYRLQVRNKKFYATSLTHDNN